MSILYFLRGLPASGKTSWALEKLTALNIGGVVRAVCTNKDEIRRQLGAEDGSHENDVIRVETQLVTAALDAGLDVIMDNTHFNPKYEGKYRRLAKRYRYAFELKFFDLPVGECIRRDRARPNPVGESVIQAMYEKYFDATPVPPSGEPARVLQWPRCRYPIDQA